MKQFAFVLLILSLVLCTLLSACKKDKHTGQELIIDSDFSDGKQGWTAGFSDYSGNNTPIYELQEGLAMLPLPLDSSKPAYRISGANRSDDLFMYLKKRVDDLKPSTHYKVIFHLEIASNAPTGGVGAGGAPGEGVGIGVGLTIHEPLSAPDANNFYKMNIGKINQCCTNGTNMVVIGNIAHSGSTYDYQLINRTGEFTASTDAKGQLWLIVGTDSGFEGTTTLYYSKIRVELFELN